MIDARHRVFPIDNTKEVDVKSAAYKMICRLLVLSMMMLPFQMATAGMIGTDQVAAAASAQAERAALLSTVSRADVASQLQSMGLDSTTAQNRVNSMTDQEVHALSGKLDSLPAGARSSGWAWVAVILIAVLLYYNWK